MRAPRTVIKKFYTISALQKWVNAKSGDFTYGDPDSARNWHKTFRHGYEYIGRIDKNHSIFKYQSRTYPRNEKDMIATYIQFYGKAVV